MAMPSETVGAEGPALALDPKTTAHRLLECTRCHEPVASPEWSGRMLVRCDSCSFEEERDLTLAASTVDVLADGPYRDPPRKGYRARKLELDLAAAMPGCAVDSLDRETLRAVLARKSLVDLDLDARAAFEWKAVWTGVWLALTQAIKGDPLRARVSLETTLLATTTPAYRALLLTHLAQHAAARGATALARKWLRACPEVSVAEVDSEVRVARALIALAKDKVDDVRRETGGHRAGDGFTRHASALAIALNLEAHERSGDFKTCDEMLADITRKGALPMILFPAAAFQIGRTAIARVARRGRRKAAFWAAIAGAAPLIGAPSLRQISVPHTLLVMGIAGLWAAALVWGSYEKSVAARLRQTGITVVSWVVPIACALAGYAWIDRTHAPLPPAAHVAPSVSIAPSAVSPVVSSSPPIGFQVGIGAYDTLDEEELESAARIALVSERYDLAERLARMCIAKNGANGECATTLVVAIERQREAAEPAR
jgi:hypothetical protein